MSSKLVLIPLPAGAIVGERSEKLLLDATACSPSPKSEALNPPSEALEGARALSTQCWELSVKLRCHWLPGQTSEGLARFGSSRALLNKPSDCSPGREQ